MSYYLVKGFDILGASISYCTTMFLVAILFIIYLIYAIRNYMRSNAGKNEANIS